VIRYLAITPARDEEAFLPGLIDSMTSQFVLPRRWIIIDDGSADKTGEIIDEAARKHRWIEPHHLPRNRPREAGGESVIMRLLPRAAWRDMEFIFRVDADMFFGPDYLSHLFAEFARDPKLGIACGALYEPNGQGWREFVQPSFHTRGGSKLYSRTCFEAIGGLASGLGWDTVDEARAMRLGFRTRTFRHIRAYHRRISASARGLWRGRLASGEAAFAAGYSPIFMLARSAANMFSPPLMMGGVLLGAGYLLAAVRRKPRLADPATIDFIRKQQIRRLTLRRSAWR
jgi:poly-beta-1,6-N-acetyl-D-glucosamine synthase